MQALGARAELLATVRDFFAQAKVLEVDTPILSQAGNTDPNIESLSCQLDGQPKWLQTSPEFAMKRLLAAGAGAIYQICHVFRGSESGRHHNPEFTMLEWYRPGWNHFQLMDEVAGLIQRALKLPKLTANRISYRAAVQEHAGVDPWHCELAQLQQMAVALGAEDGLHRDACLDLILSLLVIPALDPGELTFVHGFPPSQAALARISDGPDGPSAERFEVFLGGVELANGYHELTDPTEQDARMEGELSVRGERGQAQPPKDLNLIAALESGLPPCAGVALGVDRLLMLKMGADHIDDVLSFPVSRA